MADVAGNGSVEDKLEDLYSIIDMLVTCDLAYEEGCLRRDEARLIVRSVKQTHDAAVARAEVAEAEVARLHVVLERIVKVAQEDAASISWAGIAQDRATMANIARAALATPPAARDVQSAEATTDGGAGHERRR